MGTLAVAIERDSTGIVGDRSDAELLEDVQSGKTESFGTLYERHRGSAYHLARQMGGTESVWDELVSIAFIKVLDAVLKGTKPAAFRAYLLTTLRNTAFDATRRARKCEFVEDVTTTSGVRSDSVTTPFFDTVIDGCDKSFVAQAFRCLPDRWRTVLKYTECDGMSPAEVAPILGMKPNAVSALAYRAREGLRQGYVQAHLRADVALRCKPTTDRLGAYVRDGLSMREKKQVITHLDKCDDCRDRFSYLTEVNSHLR